MPPERDPAQPPADALARAATLLLLGLAALTTAPALAAGAAAAHQLRKRSLRWTWTVPAIAATAPALIAAGPAAVTALADAATSGDPAPAVLPAILLNAALAPAATAALMLRQTRKDRLHGGHRERNAADAKGPIAARRLARARTREAAAGPHTVNGVLLGTDHRGAPVRIPALQAHATIVGGSNSGKTNTATVLLEAQVAGGGGFIVLDGKGGRDLPHAAVTLAQQHGRPVQLWSLDPYADERLDRHRLPWNPCGGANATEVKDRIAATEEQTEPYYRALASRGLLIASRATIAINGTARLDELAHLLEEQDALKALLADDDPAALWLAGLQPKEQSALKGMGTRLRVMVDSDGGEALVPRPDADQIDLLDAIESRALVVFTLPQGSYPEVIPHVTRYLLQALNAACSRLEAKAHRADAMVFVDELSAFDGDQLCAGLERGRSAGVRYLVATQSLSNFAAAGGDKLLHAAIDNAELLVIHRQAVPDTAELLASIGGTEEAWEHTHQVLDRVAAPLGFDETGVRARRLTDQFTAHPNVIKRLGRGEAIIVTQRPAFAVRQLSMRKAGAR